MISSLENDAAIALTALNGKEIHGRTLKLEFAIKKDNKKSSSKPDNISTGAKAMKIQSNRGSSKENTQPDSLSQLSTKVDTNIIKIRPSFQVLIMGIPEYVDKKVFRNAARRISKEHKISVQHIREVSNMKIHFI